MERITLNMVPTGVLEVCHASQYDIGREIRFDLIDGTDDFVLSGDEDITIFIRDFKGNLIVSSAPNTSSNYVVWTSSEGELDVSGPAICELRVTKDDDVLGSANFIMEIEADAYDGTGVHVETVGPADICTFETTLPEPLQSVIVDIEATGGNGTPDNPIPLNGYTEANITRCGVNLWDEEWEVGNIDGTGADSPANDRIRSKGYIQVKGTNAVYLVIPTAIVVHKYGIDKSYLGNNHVASSGVFSISSDVAFIRFRTDTSYGTTYNNDISINYPSSDTTYHAYNGTTHVISFGQTVYGGVLDVTRGKLHVTHAGVNLSDLNWVSAGSGGTARFQTTSISPKTIEDNYTTPDFKCSHYRTLSWSNVGSEDKFITQLGGDTPIIAIVNRDYSDVDTFKASLSGAMLAYELATPFDIDLTPKVISAVVGTNNVSADCGETEVKYLKAGA